MSWHFVSISGWRFDKKMRVFVSLTIACTTIFILAASAVLFWVISLDNSRKIAGYQLSMTAGNFSADFYRYKDMAVALILNGSVQDYLSFPKSENSRQYYAYASLAKEMLLSTCNLNPAIYSIAVINPQENDFIIRLRNSSCISIFRSIYEKELLESLPAGDGVLRMTYNNAYTGTDEQTLNLYFQVYSSSILHKKLGAMCISLKNDQLDMLSGRSTGESSDMYFIDSHGTILAAGDKNLLHSPFPYFSLMNADSGSFSKKSGLYIYRRITGWGYYLVQKIPKKAMLASSVHIFMLLLAVIVLMVAAGIFLSDKMVTAAYRPLDDILHTIDLVKTDRLGIRIDGTYGEDFAKLAAAFNRMMDEIELLVYRIRQEQQEKSTIRLNALQSQIQPHFLYNTLECIHWQAMADGNHEIAKLVMALASYYRICLSGGKDRIPLRQELQHVKDYLLIQNIRYGDIIRSELSVGSDLLDVLIPKISLQPLVENAIGHGIRVQNGQQELIRITAERAADDVSIFVINSGSGISEEQIRRMNDLLLPAQDNPGYGIRNVNRRIQLSFGSSYGLAFAGNTLGGVTVTVHIPYSVTDAGAGDSCHV
jgi:two-component system, sensor histidine kinase YesM